MTIRKIDIFVNGEYKATTIAAKTCKEAAKRYAMVYSIKPELVKANFQPKRKGYVA